MAARLALVAGLVLPLLQPAAAADLSDITASLGLTENYQFAFPDSELSNSASVEYITSKWSLNGHINFGTDDIVFSPDPASSNSTVKRRDESTNTTDAASPTKSKPAAKTLAASPSATGSANGPVLRIEYPQGSYSNSTGGTQFYAEPLTPSDKSKLAVNATSNGQFERMLLSYDIWFPEGFVWNQGGKLPGLRGGPDSLGCSGGHKSDGKSCFSTRLMWRAGALGEVYSYIPTTNIKNFCQKRFIVCNSDYGTSLGRGSFQFQAGQWQTVWLYVALNEPGIANGVVSMWKNGVMAFQLDDLELRASEGIESIGGLYFSTFFGGYTADWATPTTQYTYFRNMELYAGLGASNAQGDPVSAASARSAPGLLAIAGVTAAALAASFIGLF